MFLGGVFALMGTVMADFRLTSFVVAILIFMGVSIGRGTSILLDGKPNTQIIRGLIFEQVLGILNFIGLGIYLT